MAKTLQTGGGTVRLTLESLGETGDGATRHIIEAAINKAMADLDDRGLQDGKPRVVKIEVVMKKISEKSMTIHTTADVKTIKYQTPVTIAVLQLNDKNRPEAIFSTVDPANPAAKELPFSAGRKPHPEADPDDDDDDDGDDEISDRREAA